MTKSPSLSDQTNLQDNAVAFAVASTLVAGIAIWWVVTRPSSQNYPVTDFINPQSMSIIADQLPSNEDDFILSAWDTVGSGVKYSAFGSVVEFQDSTVACQNCLLPQQILGMAHPSSNCVGKSVLLTSILRNRLPADRVYMVVGKAHMPPRPGGHAWVMVKRGSGWYLLESTVPPPLSDPWRRVELSRDIYEPEAFVNDNGIYCATGELCREREKVEVKGICPCRY